MTLGIYKSLLMSTAMSAVLTTTAFVAHTTPGHAQSVDRTLMAAPAADPRLKYFPEGFDFTTLGFPAGFDPKVSGFPAGYMDGFDPTLMPLPRYAPAPVDPDEFEDVTLRAAPAPAPVAADMEDRTLMAAPVPEPATTPDMGDPTLRTRPAPETLPPEIDITLLSPAEGAALIPAPSAPTPPAGGPDPVDPGPVVDPNRPTDIPDVGPLPVFTGIGLSALSPPENVVLTQAVEITGGPVGPEQFVQATGQTIFGAVMDPGAFDIVDVTLQPSGRMTTVDVSPTTGQFSTRVFEDDFGPEGSVTLTMTAANSANPEVEPQEASYTLQAAMPEDGFVQALSRVTYGATPQLYAKVRAIGFAAYVEEQLDPDTIPDVFFNALRVENLIVSNMTSTTLGLNDLIEYEIARAAYSEKQLQEVMGNFWANHFHASEKGARMHQQTIDDREFFRENAFGTFEDMLRYSARSPLMSRFLDNTDNRRGNLNENYGREILELHTVGVNGGYDDVDVIAVSEIFTGWTYEWINRDQVETQPRQYVFDFREDRHELGDKEVPFLGITITGREGEDGVQEGDELIAALAMDPRTQNYVCGKIVQKFVADMPPASFVQNCVNAWAASGGSSEAMLRAILLDPAYINTPALQRSQSKTPFEYAASFVRAFDFLPPADREGLFYPALRRAITDAGYNFTTFPVPTGLPEVGAAWLSSAAMIELYQEVQELARNAQVYGSDLQSQMLAAGLETAEDAAAFMLAIATADRFRAEEYDAVVQELKGSDGFFEPAIADETIAIRRAIALIAAFPSFQLQ